MGVETYFPEKMAGAHLASNATKTINTPAKHSTTLNTMVFGKINFLFMCGYAVGLYINGNLGDKLNPRKFYSFGLLMTAILYGFVYFLGEDRYRTPIVFELTFLCDGFFQSIGNPCVSVIIGNWFPKLQRAKAMTAWATSQGFGNLVGSQIAGRMLKDNVQWMDVMLVNSILLFINAVLVFFFLQPFPSSRAFKHDDQPQIIQNLAKEDQPGIAFFTAWTVPNVFRVCLSYGFIKLIDYGLLFNLSVYITREIPHA